MQIIYVNNMTNNNDLESELCIEIILILIAMVFYITGASISRRVWNFQKGLHLKWQALPVH